MNKSTSLATEPAIVSVYVLFADQNEAARIGQSAIEAKLAACVNILGTVQSIYQWQGAIENAQECAAFFKTSPIKVDALVAHIAHAHSYETPAIMVLPISAALTSYAQWVHEELDGALK